MWGNSRDPDLWGGWEAASRTERLRAAPTRWGPGLSCTGCNLRLLVCCRAPAVSSSAHRRPCAPPALGETPDRERNCTWSRLLRRLLTAVKRGASKYILCRKNISATLCTGHIKCKSLHVYCGNEKVEQPDTNSVIEYRQFNMHNALSAP